MPHKTISIYRGNLKPQSVRGVEHAENPPHDLRSTVMFSKEWETGWETSLTL